jgi:hypothetical protein
MSLLYTFSTGSTEVYSLPSYSSVTSAQTVSQISNSAVKSVYNTNYQKIFAGPTNSSTGLTVYNSGNTATIINISGNTLKIDVDNTNDLVVVLQDGVCCPGSVPFLIIDASSNTILYTLNIDGYKGGLAIDSNNGYCYVVGSSDLLIKVDILNGVTADTINIGDNGVQNKNVIYNPTNNYIYTFEPSSRIKIWDASDNSFVGSVNITANTSFFIYNPDKNYIYVGNVTGVTDDFVITTIRCSNNTRLSETFIYSGATTSNEQDIFGFYSPDTQYLYVGDVNSDSILVLTT